MPMFIYITLILATIFSFLSFLYNKKNGGLRILARLLINYHRFHDSLTETLERSNGTVLLKLPSWCGGKDVFLTSDPENLRHVTSTKFSNYPKGIHWRKRFYFFGDSLFTSDLEEWMHHRNLARTYFSHKHFQQFADNIFRDTIETELIPALEHVAHQRLAVSLHGLLRRYLYCFACCLSTGYKPKFLDFAFSEDPFPKAMDDVFDAFSSQFLMPESIKKLLMRLGYDPAGNKLRKASETIDHIFYHYVSMKQEEIMKGEARNGDEDFSALKVYMTGDELFGIKPPSHKFLRDTIFGFTFAIEETSSFVLAWFFWLLSKNPKSETDIREELEKIRPMTSEVNNFHVFNEEELSNMVYLHAGLCETLRLYPPVVTITRTALEPDTFPSGHQIDQNTLVMISTYAMGRMTSVWGQDCHEFKPERWITKDGTIRHEALHKFSAFSAGPRICLGKEVGFTLLKGFAATIIHNYNVQIVADNLDQVPQFNFKLHFKDGLMVRLNKRWA